MKPVALLVASVLFVLPSYTQTTKKSSTASRTCGGVLPLDIPGMKRLDLLKHISSIVDNAGFTKADYDKFSRDDTEQLVFHSYNLAYITWKKQEAFPREQVNQMVDKAAGTMDRRQLTASEKEVLDAWLRKLRAALVKAFELGRYDALHSVSGTLLLRLCYPLKETVVI